MISHILYVFGGQLKKKKNEMDEIVIIVKRKTYSDIETVHLLVSHINENKREKERERKRKKK